MRITDKGRQIAGGLGGYKGHLLKMQAEHDDPLITNQITRTTSISNAIATWASVVVAAGALLLAYTQYRAGEEKDAEIKVLTQNQDAYKAEKTALYAQVAELKSKLLLTSAHAQSAATSTEAKPATPSQLKRLTHH